MSNSINISPSAATPDSNHGATPDSNHGGGSSSPDGAPHVAPPADPASALEPDPADLRLVIEDDQAVGSYVYKTIDRRTGQIVQQYPREQVLRLREASDYTAGTVIKAKV